jgi:hypothetical protein
MEGSKKVISNEKDFPKNIVGKLNKKYLVRNMCALFYNIFFLLASLRLKFLSGFLPLIFPFYKMQFSCFTYFFVKNFKPEKSTVCKLLSIAWSK